MTNPSVYPQPGPAAGPAKSGKGGYLIGGAVIVITLVIGVVLLVIGFVSVAEVAQFPQAVSSNGTVEITKTGNYIIYEIGPDVYSDDPTISASSVHLEGPSGPISVGAYGTSRTSSTGARKAYAVATFHADETGVYSVSADNLESGHVLGVGDGTKVNAAALVGGFLIGGMGFLIGVIILIVTAVKNGRNRPMTPPGGYAMGPYGQPPMPYGQPPAPGPYGQPPAPGAYGQPPAPGSYGQPPAPASYGQPPTQNPYGQPPSGPGPYGQSPPAGQPPYGPSSQEPSAADLPSVPPYSAPPESSDASTPPWGS